MKTLLTTAATALALSATPQVSQAATTVRATEAKVARNLKSSTTPKSSTETPKAPPPVLWTRLLANPYQGNPVRNAGELRKYDPSVPESAGKTWAELAGIDMTRVYEQNRLGKGNKQLYKCVVIDYNGKQMLECTHAFTGEKRIVDVTHVGFAKRIERAILGLPRYDKNGDPTIIDMVAVDVLTYDTETNTWIIQTVAKSAQCQNPLLGNTIKQTFLPPNHEDEMLFAPPGAGNRDDGGTSIKEETVVPGGGSSSFVDSKPTQNNSNDTPASFSQSTWGTNQPIITTTLVNVRSPYDNTSIPPGSFDREPVPVTPIPEPETYALMLLGLGAVALRRRWTELKNRANQFLRKGKRN